ncbi:Spo0E like sporulation regulatory protein [compost metagenome]
MNMEQLSGEISSVKRLLEWTAARYQYNFQHPSVIVISQKLDVLIVRYIKQSCKRG